MRQTSYSRLTVAYVKALKSLVPRVIEVEGDDRYPDCCFVEDTAVVLGHRALITRPGHTNRRGETKAVADVLRSTKLEITHMEEPATLDGGDVLFSGHELFVGLSSRTNEVRIAISSCEPSR